MKAALLLFAFSVPLLAQQNHSAPAWYDHAVIYEIYPRSFQDTNGDGVGDLKGVTQHLDYLQGLGVDAIWLTPFFPSPNLDFGYDISNYTEIAPEYGTLADWDNLVAEARKRHIRVLVDFVLNHSSDKHPWFLESASSRNNPKRNWYVWKDGRGDGQPPTNWPSIFAGTTWTLDAKTGQWYYHIFAPFQPDLNWADPGLRKAMFDVARFWLDHGASGFRLDAVPYLFEDPHYSQDPHPDSGRAGLKPYNSNQPENNEVMRQLRAILDSHPGKPVLLGESLTPNIQSLSLVYGKHHDEVQLPMNFMIGDMTKLDAGALKKSIDEAHTQLPGTAVHFFSSHDHVRQFTQFGDGIHNQQIARISAALTLLPGGTSLLYYGEEIGMPSTAPADLAQVPIGPNRPRADDRDGARTPMLWTSGTHAGFTTGTPWLPASPSRSTTNVQNEATDPTSLLQWYKSLIALRRTPLFATGSYIPLESGNPQVFAFGRSLLGKGSLVAINLSAAPQTVQITGAPVNLAGSKLLLGTSGVAAPTSTTFTLAPFAVLVSSTR